MRWSRTGRIRVGWMAACALLVAALAPTVSRTIALVSGHGLAWADICSVARADRVRPAAGAGSSRPDAPPAAMADPCPYCMLQFHAMAPPPTASSVMAFLRPAAARPPALFLAAPRTLHAWATAQPRAPPPRA